MRQREQLARYSVLVGYVQYFKRGGSILDVGCGEGILQEKLSVYDYVNYVGIDVSEIAIDKALQNQDKKTRFVKANADEYTPEEHFDVIVFNESLYYFDDPLKTLEKYMYALKKDGIIIISTYALSERAIAVLEMVKETHTFSLLDEVKTTCGSKAWICSIFMRRL